jgi:hypothetical protein
MLQDFEQRDGSKWRRLFGLQFFDGFENAMRIARVSRAGAIDTYMAAPAPVFLIGVSHSNPASLQ